MPLYPPVASTTSLLDQGVRFWYRQAVLATVPLGYWRLGEPSGTVAVDEMGANNGTYVNTPTLGVAGLLTGDLNTAMTVSSTEEMLTPITNLGTGTAAFSVSVWANVTPNASYNRLFTSEGASLTNCIIAYWQNAAGLNLARYDSGGGNDTLALGVMSGLQRVVMTYDGTSIRGYRNGVLVGSPLASSRSITPGALRFGAAVSGIAGTLDEPVVWNRALTAAEIAALDRIGSGT